MFIYLLLDFGRLKDPSDNNLGKKKIYFRSQDIREHNRGCYDNGIKNAYCYKTLKSGEKINVRNMTWKPKSQILYHEIQIDMLTKNIYNTCNKHHYRFLLEFLWGRGRYRVLKINIWLWLYIFWINIRGEWVKGPIILFAQRPW